MAAKRGRPDKFVWGELATTKLTVLVSPKMAEALDEYALHHTHGNRSNAIIEALSSMLISDRNNPKE